jgi:hypothetical protein
VSVPEIIEKLQRDLDELVSKDNLPYLKIEDAAKLFDMHKDTLRQSIYNGACPFGFGYPPTKGHSGYGRIPKLTFYRWVTAQTGAVITYAKRNGSQE